MARKTKTKPTTNTPQRNIDDDDDLPKIEKGHYTDDELEETIDYLLKSMDLNQDGFIEYSEYRNGS